MQANGTAGAASATSVFVGGVAPVYGDLCARSNGDRSGAVCHELDAAAAAAARLVVAACTAGTA